jgi:hypothetical protein
MDFNSASAWASVSAARQLHGRLAGDGARHDGFDQGAARSSTNGGKHQVLVLLGNADVAGDEFALVFEFGQRLVGRHQHGGLAR